MTKRNPSLVISPCPCSASSYSSARRATIMAQKNTTRSEANVYRSIQSERSADTHTYFTRSKQTSIHSETHIINKVYTVSDSNITPNLTRWKKPRTRYINCSYRNTNANPSISGKLHPISHNCSQTSYADKANSFHPNNYNDSNSSNNNDSSSSDNNDSSSNNSDIDLSECCICFNDIINQVILSCKHKFCFECLSSWYLTSNTCPLCRRSIRQSRPVWRRKPLRTILSYSIVLLLSVMLVLFGLWCKSLTHTSLFTLSLL